MKGLPYISIVLAGLVIINEVAYIGKSDLAWVIIGLALAIGLNSLALLHKKTQPK